MAKLHALGGVNRHESASHTLQVKDRNHLPAHYEQLQVKIDPELGALWAYMRPPGVPCFRPKLLEEIADLQRRIEESKGVIIHDEQPVRLRYYLQASGVPGVYNYGGDLALFARLAEERNREVLLRYATVCVDNIFRCVRNFGQPITTLSVVQGDALGGGFECALTMNVLVAERSAKLGFPEILFNMFPGMGAYSFLARRVSMQLAEDMMYSGATYTGAELAQMGIVDVLAEDGQGEVAARDYMKDRLRRYNGFSSIMLARRAITPVTREELLNITTIWVDAVLQLESKDIRMMQRLARAQQARHGATEHVETPASVQRKSADAPLIVLPAAAQAHVVTPISTAEIPANDPMAQSVNCCGLPPSHRTPRFSVPVKLASASTKKRRLPNRHTPQAGQR